MSDFQPSGSGEMSLLRSLHFSREVGWTRTGRSPLLTVVWLIPGESLWAPCAPLPLPGIGGRLHGDGSARHLLHLLIAQLRGQGCAGGCVSREVRASFAKEQFLASWLCFFPCPTCQDLARALPSHDGRGRFAAALNCTGISGAEICLFSCAWECVTLLPKLRDSSCHHRAFSGKHSGVSVCCACCVFPSEHLPFFSKSSSAAGIVVFPDCSSSIAWETKELLLCLHHTCTYVSVFYADVCLCVLMNSTSAVPASVLLLCSLGRDGVGWVLSWGCLQFHLCSFAFFSLFPQDAPSSSARPPCS